MAIPQSRERKMLKKDESSKCFPFLSLFSLFAAKILSLFRDGALFSKCGAWWRIKASPA
jgi:hypothetical protein